MVAQKSVFVRLERDFGALRMEGALEKMMIILVVFLL